MACCSRVPHLLPATLLLLFAIAGGSATAAQRESEPPEAFATGAAPTDVTELRDMQTHVQRLVSQLVPTTVAVLVGQAHGSGVIINSEGYVLTAAHVAGKPNQIARVRLHDGRRVEAKTLGVFRTVDAGLVQITTLPESGGWPAAPMGDSTQLREGDWCLATGHPGGFQHGRNPVLRVGRVLHLESDAIRTDCTLIGGDSGGPLFDMDGRVIGIHSRIGQKLSVNLHVPVNEFRVSWDRLVAADAWGQLPGSDQLTDPDSDRPGPRQQPAPYIGVEGFPNSEQAKIKIVFPGQPAEAAGIEVGDAITRFNGRPITTFESLQRAVVGSRPGEVVVVEVLRNEQRRSLRLKVGERSARRGRED